ncbi:hypothetical protein BDEG_26328 [Batrachochytrium dendrobatidis JEL423]|uniref:NTF2 domain-containing protein n=1 Tax=Batrachochytrium dendrobatidis (strain JEL423) TaxID=403673 RepID=A0A177WS53_BATDL|nr:hypothetical protein BDEG_26328 [Batrachochytrium dendrobatidis JEL423]
MFRSSVDPLDNCQSGESFKINLFTLLEPEDEQSFIALVWMETLFSTVCSIVSTSMTAFLWVCQSSQSYVDPFEVGWLFVQEYYTFLNKDPERLHCFYNKKSVFVHGTEGDNTETCYGQSVRI